MDATALVPGPGLPGPAGTAVVTVTEAHRVETVSSAPMRITLAGGGIDLPEVYRLGPVHLLAATVELAVHVAVAGSRAGAARAAGLPGPAAYVLELDGSDRNPYLLAARALLGVGTGFHLAVRSDVLPGSGLGGSGAFCAALLDAIARHHGWTLTPAEVAELAFRLERDRLRRNVGKQDAWVAVSGGAVRLDLSAEGHVTASAQPRLGRALEALWGDSLLLFALPGRHDAGRVLSAAKPASAGFRAEALEAAADAEQAYLSRDPAVVGSMLRRQWERKVRHNPAADHAICRRVQAESAALGIHGFKLVGAGGGGHLLVALDPARRADAVARLGALGAARVRTKLTGRRLAGR